MILFEREVLAAHGSRKAWAHELIMQNLTRRAGKRMNYTISAACVLAGWSDRRSPAGGELRPIRYPSCKKRGTRIEAEAMTLGRKGTGDRGRETFYLHHRGCPKITSPCRQNTANPPPDKALQQPVVIFYRPFREYSHSGRGSLRESSSSKDK